METINSLNDVERTLLRAVVESDEVLTAGELSKQFKEEAGVSYATFNRTLEKGLREFEKITSKLGLYDIYIPSLRGSVEE